MITPNLSRFWPFSFSPSRRSRPRLPARRFGAPEAIDWSRAAGRLGAGFADAVHNEVRHSRFGF